MTTLPPLPYAPPPAPPASAEPKGGRPGHGRGFGSGAGRPPGSRNKTSIALKEAILLAAETVGDSMADAAEEKGEQRQGGLAGYLEMVAATDVKSFCALLGRVLPMTLTGEKGAIEVVFKTVYEGEKPPIS